MKRLAICLTLFLSERQNDGNILKSIEHNKARFGIDHQLAQILINTVNALGFVEG